MAWHAVNAAQHARVLLVLHHVLDKKVCMALTVSCLSLYRLVCFCLMSIASHVSVMCSRIWTAVSLKALYSECILVVPIYRCSLMQELLSKQLAL